MKTLFWECGMGAAGDMLAASLFELVPDKKKTLCSLNELGIPNINYCAETVTRCGIRGTLMKVFVNGETESEMRHREFHAHGVRHSHAHDPAEVGGEHVHATAHHHSSMHEIESIIMSTSLSDKAKKDAIDIYKLIAEAESDAHGISVTDVHFHEVGKMDAIADISAVCYLMEELAPAKVIASSICTGFGHVRCAHGILPVPAPATALILRGVPVYGGNIGGELCTPTGAAILKYFASSFSSMPEMRVAAVGYGMGSKSFVRTDPKGNSSAVANCVRAFWGEA